MTTFGRQAIGLLDYAGVERAVLGGTSLGANAALEAAAAAPERVRGLLIEMPVLDNALLGCAIAFTPLLVGLTFGAPVARLAGRAAKLVPLSDSDMLVRELPNARLVEASSVLELRLTPERLTGEIVAFTNECFRAGARSGGRRRSTGSKARSPARRRPST